MATNKDTGKVQVLEQLKGVLERNGFSDLEIKVFSILFFEGAPQKATVLSRQTGIGRTTLYGTLKTLMARGIVLSPPEPGVARFYSVEPEQFIATLEKARKRIDTDIKHSQELLPTITAFRNNSKRNLPKVQFLSGVDGIKTVYNETLTTDHTDIYEIIGTPTLYKLLDFDFIQQYIKNRADSNIHMHTLATESEEARMMQKKDKDTNRTTTLLPPEYHFDIGVVVYKDKTAITSFAADYPLAVLIADEKIANAMKTMFRLIDNLLRKCPSQTVQ